MNIHKTTAIRMVLFIGMASCAVSRAQELVQNGNFASGSQNWNHYSTYSWELTFNPYAQDAVNFDNWSHIWQDLSATYQPGVSYEMTVNAQVGAGQMDGLQLGLTSVQTGDWPPLVSTIESFPAADQNPVTTSVPSSSAIDTFTWTINANALSAGIANTAGANWGNNIDLFVVPYENSGDYGWVNIFSVSLQEVAVPGPSTLVFSAAGLGMVALCFRRR